jgi:hypothetical protein
MLRRSRKRRTGRLIHEYGGTAKKNEEQNEELIIEQQRCSTKAAGAS